MTDKQLTKRILLTEYIGESMPIYALVPIYFSEFGLASALQVGVLLAVWQVTSIMFEIPTGIISDKFSRRLSILLARLLRLVSFCIWIYAPHFYGFLAGIIVFSVGDAFLSGSVEAYSYDELTDKKTFNRLRQRTVAIHLAAFSTGGAIAFLVRADYESIMLITLGLSFVSVLLTFILPKDSRHAEKLSSYKSIVKKAAKEVRMPKVYSTFLTATMVLALTVFFIEQINIFYKQTEIATQTVALVMAVGNLFTFGLLWAAHLYEKWSRKHQNLLLISLYGLLVFSVFLTSSVALQIGAIFLFVRVARIANVHTANDLQHVLRSGTRATVASISSFAGRTVAAVAIFSVGMLVQKGSHFNDALLLVGLLLLSLAVYFSVVAKKSNK